MKVFELFESTVTIKIGDVYELGQGPAFQWLGTIAVF